VLLLLFWGLVLCLSLLFVVVVVFAVIGVGCA